MNKLGIFGTSGFARELGDIAHELNFEPVYIARNSIEINNWSFNDDVIVENEIEKLGNIGFAIGIGENFIRKKIASSFFNKLRFVNLIHPAATFGCNQLQLLQQSCGVIVCAGVRFTNNINIGNFSIFNLNSTIGHDVIVEDFVNIAPGANISGNVHIEQGCWIGTGAVINQGDNKSKLKIGSDTVIGSGSVVVKPCEPNSVYVGIPAKKIK